MAEQVHSNQIASVPQSFIFILAAIQLRIRCEAMNHHERGFRGVEAPWHGIADFNTAQVRNMNCLDLQIRHIVPRGRGVSNSDSVGDLFAELFGELKNSRLSDGSGISDLGRHDRSFTTAYCGPVMCCGSSVADNPGNGRMVGVSAVVRHDAETTPP